MRADGDSTSTDAAPSAGDFCTPALGTIIDGRYRIVRAIGTGGMGAVFEAEHVALGRRYAVKFLRSDLAGRSRLAERFQREARLLGRLEHDHLATVIDVGVHHGKLPFLVMEFLEGSTLRDWLTEHGPLPTGLAIDILLQAARGMAHVHARGIVHRDLKPSNMILTTRSDGRVWLKILDFGIARDIGEAEGLLTPSGVELGTAQYMSPEQARGAKDIDARSDVYALGGIIYEALTGRRAHPGDSYNAVIFHLLTQVPRPLAEMVPDCPDDVVAIVERCVEKDPARRYPDAQALAEALLSRGAASADGTLSAGVTGSRSAMRPRSKISWFAAGIAVGGVAMAAVGALRTGQELVPWTRGSAATSPATTTVMSSNAPNDVPPVLALHAALSEPDVPMSAEVGSRSPLPSESPQHRARRGVNPAEHAGSLPQASESVEVASKRGDSPSRDGSDATTLIAVNAPAQPAATDSSLRLVTANPYDGAP